MLHEHTRVAVSNGCGSMMGGTEERDAVSLGLRHERGQEVKSARQMLLPVQTSSMSALGPTQQNCPGCVMHLPPHAAVAGLLQQTSSAPVS